MAVTVESSQNSPVLQLREGGKTIMWSRKYLNTGSFDVSHQSNNRDNEFASSLLLIFSSHLLSHLELFLWWEDPLRNLQMFCIL